MLEVEDVCVSYGRVQVLFDVSLKALPGEVLCLMGRNGAGKTTILKSIMGLQRASRGQIRLDGTDLGSLPAHAIPRNRVGYVPQGRRLFPELSVAENIEMGAMLCPAGRHAQETVLDMFPRLRERLKQRARTLSGGEQQMLAMARALCLQPRLLLMDEPGEGLQPTMLHLIRRIIMKMKVAGLAVILVEHRVDMVLAVADQVLFIENGRDREMIPAATLRDHPDKIHQYLGV